MNPNETSQHQKRQADHNLDESQSSSVSIKIFNKNDDNVVIRLYRNNTKTSRDRFKNSSGHTRQGAGGCERKDKRKPTMFRNLYRNTFGPTIDETVLVGMETFHICQQDANTSCNSGCNDPHTSNEDFGTNRNSIIPNELSWDCSTLLPTNNNEKHYESVCTNTSDYALDKEMDLCPQLTNQYQYNPFCDKNQNKTSCPHSPSSKAFNQGNGSNEEAEETCPMNNISSDENLSKHISSEGINASYKTDITRSTITDSKHDTNKTLASISTYSGTKDPNYVVSELGSEHRSSDAGRSNSENRSLDFSTVDAISNCEEFTKKSDSIVEHEAIKGILLDIGVQVAESIVSTTSCSENCLLCQESIKNVRSSDSNNRKTEIKVFLGSNLLSKKKESLKVKHLLEKSNHPTSAAEIQKSNNVSKSSQKLKISKSYPGQNSFKQGASLLSPKSSTTKVRSKTGSTVFTSTFVLSTIVPSKLIRKNEETSQSQTIVAKPNQITDRMKKNLKVVEFCEIPEWERKKGYPTARFVQRKLKKLPFKKLSRLTAGSDRRSKMLFSSCSTSSWMTRYSLRNNFKNISSLKAREICKSLQKIENKPVLKVKHVLSTSSSSNFSTSSSISSSTCAVLRQKSGESSYDADKSVIFMHGKLAPIEDSANDSPITTGKDRLSNADIMLPPDEIYLQDSSTKTRSSINSPAEQPRKTSYSKMSSSNSEENLAMVQNNTPQNPQVVHQAPKAKPGQNMVYIKEYVQNFNNNFPRQREEYCRSTGVIYSDPSTAAICPNSRGVEKLWDHKDKEVAKRKPLLEKLVDVISDYSKRSSLVRYPTFCATNKSSSQGDYRNRLPRRTPILQKLFGVFSKKSVNQRPGCFNENFDDIERNKRPVTCSSFGKSTYTSQTLESRRGELELKKRCSMMEEKYSEIENRNHDIDKRRNKIKTCSKINQYTETEKESLEDFREADIGKNREEYCETKIWNNGCEDRKKCSRCPIKHPEAKATATREERRRCNNDTCPNKNRYAAVEQRQLNETEEKRKNLISQPYPMISEQIAKIQNKKTVDLERRASSGETKKCNSLEDVADSSFCCNCSRKQTSQQSVSQDTINKGRCIQNSNGNLPDCICVSLNSLSSQVSFRISDAKIYKKTRKDSGSDKNNRLVGSAFLEQTMGSERKSRIKIKKGKSKYFGVSTFSEGGDVQMKKAKASSKRKVDKYLDYYNYRTDENTFKDIDIQEKLNSILERGIQMNINDLPSKYSKPLMWRSFMENKHFKDVVSHLPQRKPTWKDRPRTAAAQVQTDKFKKCLCKKCFLSSNQSISKEEETSNHCAFQDCSQETVSNRNNVRFEEATTNTRFAGGCEHKACMKKAIRDADKTDPKRFHLNKKVEDYPCCSNRRKSRQTSKRATITLKTDTESRKESCRCEKEKLNRNNTPQETRYAITRVTKYDDYTTYEILKSTRARPKKIPEVLEKIFIEKDL